MFVRTAALLGATEQHPSLLRPAPADPAQQCSRATPKEAGEPSDSSPLWGRHPVIPGFSRPTLRNGVGTSREVGRDFGRCEGLVIGHDQVVRAVPLGARVDSIAFGRDGYSCSSSPASLAVRSRTPAEYLPTRFFSDLGPPSQRVEHSPFPGRFNTPLRRERT